MVLKSGGFVNTARGKLLCVDNKTDYYYLLFEHAFSEKERVTAALFFLFAVVKLRTPVRRYTMLKRLNVNFKDA